LYTWKLLFFFFGIKIIEIILNAGISCFLIFFFNKNPCKCDVPWQICVDTRILMIYFCQFWKSTISLIELVNQLLCKISVLELYLDILKKLSIEYLSFCVARHFWQVFVSIGHWPELFKIEPSFWSDQIIVISSLRLIPFKFYWHSAL
jgi:hypothetical protein